MGRTVRCALCALVTGAVAAGWVLGLGAAAGAAPVAPSRGALTTPAVSPARAVTPNRAAARARAVAPASGGVLRPGMRGPAVRKLQQQLALLHYYPGRVNGYFGHNTLEAVWAFKEVQGISTARHPNQVRTGMQRALADPRLPRVLAPRGPRRRIEINLRRQVLVLYRHGRVALISHISPGGGYYYPCPGGGGTCGPAITPDGNYRAHRFASGWVTVPLGEMYNPVFFIGGLYAIHGDIPVPLRPVSHGCVRIPMDIARFFHKLIRISPAHGTRIYIRGHAPGTGHEAALRRQANALP